jgi:hypothetical protein
VAPGNASELVDDPDADLRADCSACVGLCCIEPAFVASADFAISKAPRTPCPHLSGDFRCSIHDRLPERGFRGCATFDCFGAGQRLVRQLGAVEPGQRMFDAFPSLRGLQELLWHLREAHRLAPSPGLRDRAEQLHIEVDRLAAAASGGADVETVRRRVGTLLEQVSDAFRSSFPRSAEFRHADLVGRDLRRTRLRGATLRGALLIGANLSGVDLTATDLLGADLRGADVRGALLVDALFLTQPQIDASVGDAATTLPERLRRPARWS